MNKTVKVILVLVAIMAVFGLAFTAIGIQFGARRGVYFNGNSIQISDEDLRYIKDMDLESFNRVEMDIYYSDIEFIKSDHYGVDICYYEHMSDPTYSVENGTLRIYDNPKNSNGGFWGIGFLFNQMTPHIKVYSPDEAEFEKVNIKDRNGDVKLDSLNAKQVDLTCYYGDVNLNDLNSVNVDIVMQNGDSKISNLDCDTLSYKNSYGNAELKNMVCTKSLTMSFKNGDLRVSGMKSEIISYENSYGDCIIYDTSSDSFEATVSNGDIKISNSILGETRLENHYGEISASNVFTKKLNVVNQNGDTEIHGDILGNTTIRSSYGNVDINTSMRESDCSYNLSTLYGDVRVGSKKYKEEITNTVSQASNSINVQCKNGDIRLTFTDDFSI